VTGLDCYRTYLAMKQHFTNPKFDFFQYDGKVKASEQKYQERTDFYFFETMARKLTDQEVKEYLLASFISSSEPSKVWIGDIKRSGKDCWLAWQKQRQSEQYLVDQDLDRLVQCMEEKGHTFNNLFETVGGHPPLLKLFIQRSISLDTIIILDMVLGFMKQWDKEFHDPLWEGLSFKVKKYKPFLSISKPKYIKLIKEKFL
jgi:hypothetical protein